MSIAATTTIVAHTAETTVRAVIAGATAMTIATAATMDGRGIRTAPMVGVIGVVHQ